MIWGTGNELARASAATIRVNLPKIKIDASVVRNTRRIRILLASRHSL